MAPSPAVWRTAASLEKEALARELCARLADAAPLAILDEAIHRVFPERIGVVSSFGAESAALLGLVAEVAPETPVVFLDTGKLFPETLAYREEIAAALGLGDVRIVRPTAPALAADDPDGDLHARQPDLCCHVRKTLPLVRALRGFDAWITGRKRHHGGDRSDLPLFEVQDGRLKVNPLAAWSADEVAAEIRRRGLPPHPLVAQGYPSIGCVPCTTRAAQGESARAGRWRGQAKTECGIHFEDGKVVRRANG